MREDRLIIAITNLFETYEFLMRSGGVSPLLNATIGDTIEASLSWLTKEQIDEVAERSCSKLLKGEAVNGWKLQYFPNGYTVGKDRFERPSWILGKDGLRGNFIREQRLTENYLAIPTQSTQEKQG